MIIFAIVVLVIIILYVIIAHNNIIEKKNKVDESLSTIDVQLEQRFDAVSQQLEVYQKSLKKESEIYEKVVELRQTLSNNKNIDEKLNAEETLNHFIKYGIQVENYPMISSISILGDHLMAEISVNEKEVAAAKRQYNSNVNRFNTYIQKFPTNIIASLFSVKEVKLYEIEDKIKRQTPINGNLNL